MPNKTIKTRPIKSDQSEPTRMTDPTTTNLIEKHFRLNPQQKKALKKLGIKTVKNLLYHFPTRYGETGRTTTIDEISAGASAGANNQRISDQETSQKRPNQKVVIYGKITGLKMRKAFRSKVNMAEGYIEDDTGRIKAVWFNQPYLAKMIREGALVRVEGTVSKQGNMTNPAIEMISEIPTGVGRSLFAPIVEKGADPSGTSVTANDLGTPFTPVYPESRGITSLWFFHAIQKLLAKVQHGEIEDIEDPIPAYILEKYNLPSLKTSLIWIHGPQDEKHAESARKRFAFEEIFLIQIEKQKARREFANMPTYAVNCHESDMQDFLSRFDFKPTNSQTKAIKAIIEDFNRGEAMSRLLEGDVGSGKTLVAAASSYAVVKSKINIANRTHEKLQVAYMCPTEILATQHFESFIKYFSHLANIKIGLVTGSGCRIFPSKSRPDTWTDISRSQLQKWIADGSVNIVIGTHALIQKSISFKNLAYVIIDEQHRFGTNQRKALAKGKVPSTAGTDPNNRLSKKGKNAVTKNATTSNHTSSHSTEHGWHKNGMNHPLPHLLSMTATPIPRTLALTLYGDLDLTLLEEMPSGRKKVLTEIVVGNRRKAAYQAIRQAISEGRQAYIICPRINEPDPDKEASLNARSVTEEARRLSQTEFKDITVGVMHGKLKSDEKDRIMEDFVKNKIQLLFSTSVIEVGVNVPNATIIMIEGAERFGLAQLHQLRGRVQRSSYQSYCFVCTEKTNQKTEERLSALTKAPNGFALAEFDLQARGAGDMYGRKQWGISDLAMEALKNIKLVEAARNEARHIIDNDPTLENFPEILAETREREINVLHME